MDKLDMQTRNIADENYAALAKLFPNALTEKIVGYDEDGKAIVERAIDVDVLRQEISCSVVEGREERYQFTWPDKKKAVLLANMSITGTLRPCKKESVEFDTTENLYIEGDNLDVLKLLHETYLGKIKMIYIDPPYNTGNDFIYADDFAENIEHYMKNSGQYDDENNRLVQNMESNGRFHTAWLNMIYPRIKLAKDLLTEDGVILISIDDNEVDNLKKICDEIYGSSNYLGTFVVNSTPNARDYGHIGKMHEFVLFYAKNSLETKTNMLPDTDKKFTYSDKKGGFNIHPLYNSNEAFTKANRPNLFYPFYVYVDKKIENNFYEIGLERKEGAVEVYPPKSLKNNVQFVWRWGKDKALKYMNEEIVGYEVQPGEYRIVQKMRHSEKIIRSLLTDTKYSSRRGTAESEEIFASKIFSFPKPTSLLYDLIKVGSDDNSIILDFFSGSSTAAHAIMQLNAEDGGKRKFIMVQVPESTEKDSIACKEGYRSICEIGKERIRRAGRKIKEENLMTAGDLDIGFRVLKLDSSNMKNVYYSPSQVGQQSLFDMTDNIKEDRTPEDLLFQVMLDLGVLLSSKIEEKVIAGKKVFNVADGFLIACFDNDVTEETVKAVAQEKPYYAVFRDSSMANDSVATNFEQIFATYSPGTVRKVL